MFEASQQPHTPSGKIPSGSQSQGISHAKETGKGTQNACEPKPYPENWPYVDDFVD